MAFSGDVRRRTKAASERFADVSPPSADRSLGFVPSRFFGVTELGTPTARQALEVAETWERFSGCQPFSSLDEHERQVSFPIAVAVNDCCFEEVMSEMAIYRQLTWRLAAPHKNGRNKRNGNARQYQRIPQNNVRPTNLLDNCWTDGRVM
jgi:hypothetical protein